MNALLLSILTLVADFGANPGALKMYEHAPDGLAAGAPVVVVMHGCTQTANDLVAAGWNDLADELGFLVVYPEQQPGNNPVRCFNWAGEYGDLANLTRGAGENASILAMVDHALATHGGDPARVFVTGFSAGAAFAAVLLATWPDRFAAGAIQAGVPFRCATSVQEAYDCQALDAHPERDKTPAEWAALVTAAAEGHGARWPRVAIWHGTADAIVDPVAADEQLEQWTAVHGLEAVTPEVTTVGTAERTRLVRDGATIIERWTIPAMGHAIALGADDPDGACAGTGAYYEDRGLCSTRRIAHFFGLFADDPDDPADPIDPDDPDDACACGCSATHGGSLGLVLLCTILAVGRRPRRASRL